MVTSVETNLFPSILLVLVAGPEGRPLPSLIQNCTQHDPGGLSGPRRAAATCRATDVAVVRGLVYLIEGPRGSTMMERN